MSKVMPEESLDRDPEFVLMHVRAQFVEDIYKAMEYYNLKNVRDLSKKIGMQQNFLKKILKEEITLDLKEMIEISVRLGLYFNLNMVCPDGNVVVMSEEDFAEWQEKKFGKR